MPQASAGGGEKEQEEKAKEEGKEKEEGPAHELMRAQQDAKRVMLPLTQRRRLTAG